VGAWGTSRPRAVTIEAHTNAATAVNERICLLICRTIAHPSLLPADYPSRLHWELRPSCAWLVTTVPGGHALLDRSS
jgi:hypothetical protein